MLRVWNAQNETTTNKQLHNLVFVGDRRTVEFTIRGGGSQGWLRIFLKWGRTRSMGDGSPLYTGSKAKASV